MFKEIHPDSAAAPSPCVAPHANSRQIAAVFFVLETHGGYFQTVQITLPAEGEIVSHFYKLQPSRVIHERVLSGFVLI